MTVAAAARADAYWLDSATDRGASGYAVGRYAIGRGYTEAEGTLSRKVRGQTTPVALLPAVGRFRPSARRADRPRAGRLGGSMRGCLETSRGGLPSPVG